ncbi:MAG: M14 metallopeptidase family protein [bacterium]
MKTRHISVLILVAVIFLPRLVVGQVLPSPEEVFGFRMGADRKLIDWDQIVGYFSTLDKSSDKIMVQELGKTTLGNPFILAIISSANNLKNLERYKAIQQQLANPYELSEEQAKGLIEEGKAVVLVSLNIHSTEIGSSQESVELAYELVTRTDSKIKRILDNVILLLMPSLNPDGQKMVVDWYRKHVGTPHEGSRVPWLYHHYAGHDNNRDWFMFNLQESRHTARVLYHEWFPEIVYDQHQTRSNGARLFVPPYSDPVNPNVYPSLMAEVNMLGKHVVSDLHSQGFKGIVSGRRYTAYFEGTMSKTPLWHNMVGILSEMASARIATPIYLPRGSLGQYGPELPGYSKVTDFLDPWEGGWWRLRDIIEYEKAVTYSILDLASTYKSKFMMTFYSLNKESIRKGESEPPFAYVIPLEQHDPSSATEMLKRLQIGGVRIFRSKSDLVFDGRTYPVGTYVIPLAQSCRPYIKDLMEPQKYPNLKLYPEGPPRPPYDVTGWTLPLQMGVNVIEVKTPIKGELSPATKYDFGSSGVVEVPAKYYLIERRFNNASALMNQLLKEGAEVYWSDEAFSVEGEDYPPGTVIVPRQEGLASSLQSLSEELRVPVRAASDPISAKGSKALLPRLGIYQAWVTSMDEGWTRLVLDTFGFSYKNLHNNEVKKGRLADKYDVIILPDLWTSAIVEGRGRRQEEPMIGTALPPKEYQGGIGKEGVEALKAFVKVGGTLITFGNACNFAIEKLRVPAVNVLKGVEQKEFYAPGSLFEMELDNTQPLAYGMPERTAIRFTNSPAFRLLPYIRESKAIGYYGDGNPLLSGWLIGPERLAGKTALAEIPVEQGRVILFGFRVQSRAQTFATFKLLFNAIYTSRMEPIESLERMTK